KLDSQARVRDVEDVRGQDSRRWLQIRAGEPGHAEDVPALVYYCARRRVLLEHQALEGSIDQLLLGRRGHSWVRPRGGSATRRAAREGELEDGADRRFDTPEDAKALVHHLEELGMFREALRGAEEEVAARPEGIVEHRNELLLQLRIQVDEQVAAGDQMKPEEGRVADQAVLGENAHPPYLLCDLIGGPVSREEACEPPRRNVLGDVGRVAGLAPFGDRLDVDIGGENLNARRRAHLGKQLVRQNAEGVCLLTRGAAWHPDPHALVRAIRCDDVRQNVLAEVLEGLRIAKELGDTDEQVLSQEISFLGVLPEKVEVLVQRCRAAQPEAATQTTEHRAAFVVAEVMARGSLKRLGDPIEGGRELFV